MQVLHIRINFIKLLHEVHFNMSWESPHKTRPTSLLSARCLQSRNYNLFENPSLNRCINALSLMSLSVSSSIFLIKNMHRYHISCLGNIYIILQFLIYFEQTYVFLKTCRLLLIGVYYGVVLTSLFILSNQKPLSTS